MKPKGLAERARSGVINSLVIAELLEPVMLNPRTSSRGGGLGAEEGAGPGGTQPGRAGGAGGRERSPAPPVRTARAPVRQPVGGGSGRESLGLKLLLPVVSGSRIRGRTQGG